MIDLEENTEIQYFLDSLNFFYEAQWLYNAPITEILLGGCLEEFPDDWLKVLQNLENQEFNDFIVKKLTKPAWPESLMVFVEKCNRMNKLPPVMPSLLSQLPKCFQKGSSPKKQHEIIQMAHLIHERCTKQAIKLIVDIGAGLGYICQLLHYLYGYKVLGLEANSKNVDIARRKQRILYPYSNDHVKYVWHEVTRNSIEKIELILENEFKVKQDICLIGLHACGDLSIDVSEIFSRMKMAQLLILMPCCYHKLTISKTVEQTPNQKQYFNNFPVSRIFQSAIEASNRDIGEFLRRPFLRLACQESTDKWHNMSEDAHRQHSFCMLARAILELYANKNDLYLKKHVQKGTRKSQCLNFETYLKDSLQRYSFKCTAGGKLPSESQLQREIISLWEENSQKLKATEAYAGLQLLLQNPAESLVLKDRMCWLKELGFQTEIISVMDRRLSPRSYAIISRKE